MSDADWTLAANAGATGSRGVRGAIANAARQTGADFDYLMVQAKIESSLNPSAQAPTSSAAGLFQFISSTWLETLQKHGSSHGLGQFSDAISFRGDKPFVEDPVMRRQIMALRFDPQAASLMAGELANDNRAALQGVLGREAGPSELYLAHFLGARGAERFLRGLQQNPDMNAAALLPRPAAANQAIFYGAGGRARSVGQVMDLIRNKVEGQMGQQIPNANPNDPSSFMLTQADGFSPAMAGARHSYGAPPNLRGAPVSPNMADRQRPSMAETLKSSFALAELGSPAARDHVRGAYAKLQAMGL